MDNQEACLKFYQDAPDRTRFDEHWNEELTVFEKLQASLKSSLQSEDDIVIIELVGTLHPTMEKNSPSATENLLESEPFSPEKQEIPCS